MKKFLVFILSVILSLAVCLTGCGSGDSSSSAASSAEATVGTAVDADDSYQDNSGDFTIETTDGAYTVTDGVYTITSAGTYSLSGTLSSGRIVVDAGDDDDVEMDLNGVTITSSSNSVIWVKNADNVDISAKSGTYNELNDVRSAKTVDSDDMGEGAIYAECDLKLKGTGALKINASYNNGVHTKDDLTVQKLTLKVVAPNNAMKGNDSVTIKSGNIILVSTAGDGLKTTSTDVNKKGVQRGTITVSGGVLNIYAAGDGIQSAYNFAVEDDGDDTVAEPTIEIFTGSYSSYTSSSASTDSYKGIKADNAINVSVGTITICSFDDGLHANYGDAFESGTTGQGTINISGGTVKITVYSPETSTATGQNPPSNPGGNPGGMNRGGSNRGFAFNQQTVSGAKGIHADNTVTVSGGTVNIDSSWEGIEAAHIIVSGGTTYVAANDDGLNATNKKMGTGVTPTIVVSGGYLDVTVSPNGDTDGIDSNGSYTQTGGIVITRGPNQSGAAEALDADGSIKISGGTIIVLGAASFNGTSGTTKYSLSLHSNGSHTVKINGTSYTFTNLYAYSQTICYSSVSVSA